MTTAMWEYRFLSKQNEKHLLVELNEIGREGWELVSINYAKDLKGVWNWTAFAKRPYTGPAPRPKAGESAAATPAASGEQTAGVEGFDLGDGDFALKD